MCRLIISIILTITICSKVTAQNIDKKFAHNFLSDLIENNDHLKDYVLSEELEISNRLNITYKGIRNKFIISNDIDRNNLSIIDISELDYDIEFLEEGYSKIILNVSNQIENNEYYFYKFKLVSKPFYFARNWKKQESKYFEFRISDTTLFNNYCLEQLDAFVEKTLDLLEFTHEDKVLLNKKKIIYFFCRNENEIELMTGYKARGIYHLPYDYIISTYNYHVHEILHLLINYKLGKNDLFTLPFLQEGFAVAFGGRGGKSKDVILEIGLFLADNKFVDYKSLLSKSEFYQFDASMTYPVAGLYCDFLISSMGIHEFLKLYKKYSGNIKQINNLKIELEDLPTNSMWLKYLKQKTENKLIRVDNLNESDFTLTILQNDSCIIKENETEYLFKLINNKNLQLDNLRKNYKSKLFDELFPDNKYNNQKYIIIAKSDEISVYNFYTNSLIAKYVKGFSEKKMNVKKENGFYIFVIRKGVFDEIITLEAESLYN